MYLDVLNPCDLGKSQGLRGMLEICVMTWSEEFHNALLGNTVLLSWSRLVQEAATSSSRLGCPGHAWKRKGEV